MCSRAEWSVHGRPAAAFLVLLLGAARARIIPPDLGSAALITREFLDRDDAQRLVRHLLATTS
jgi:hypothetical protein